MADPLLRIAREGKEVERSPGGDPRKLALVKAQLAFANKPAARLNAERRQREPDVERTERKNLMRGCRQRARTINDKHGMNSHPDL
jgi:hypothetical protein